MNELGVVVPFFGDSPVRREHLHKIVVMLESNKVDYAVMFDPTLPKMWQKEYLLNRGLDLLRNKYIMFLDSDVLFLQSDWLERILAELKKVNAVQCCSHYRQLGSVEESSIYSWLDRRYRHLSCTGGAWAFHRQLLVDCGGLFEKCIVGGGDALYSCAAFGASELRTTGFCFYRPTVFHALLNWCDNFGKLATFGCANLIGDCLPHGPMKQRRYYHRHKLLEHFELEHVENGRWTKKAPKDLQRNVAKYIDSIN